VFLLISQATCLCGVVQGFVLGLLLFLIRSTVHPDFSHSLNHTYTTHTRCSFYPSDFDSRTLYTTVHGWWVDMRDGALIDPTEAVLVNFCSA